MNTQLFQSPIALQNNGASAPTKFTIVGERSSGTNYCRDLVTRHLNLGLDDGYGWKHGFLQAPAVSPNTLMVVVVRGAYDWLKSFYSRPFEVHPALIKTDFKTFISTQWRSTFGKAVIGSPVRRKYSGLFHEELIYDRDPLTGARFENVCKLRTAKLIAHTHLKNTFNKCCVVNYEYIRDHPEMFLKLLSDEYGIEMISTFKPSDRLFGHHGSTNVMRSQHAEKSIVDSFSFIQSELDQELEEKLGYRYAQDAYRF